MKKEFIVKRDDNRQIVKSYIHIVKPFLKGLRQRESDVFAEIIYQYYLRADIKNPKDRFLLIFNPESRAEIAKNINMTAAGFRNAISSLKRRKLIKPDNTIDSTWLLNLKESKISVTFVFTLNK